MPSLLRQARRALKSLLPQREETLACGPISLVLPPGHLLGTYQRQHPRYDRFLPHLAAQLAAGDGVIDVGANCGDTLAAMVVANPALRFLCIEPDPAFIAYFERNLSALRAQWPALEVQLAASLVGREVTSAALEGSGGTKHAKPGAGGMAASTLDSLLAAQAFAAVRLLKSDVDGFDWDVLNSAAELLRREQPLLFFECHFADAAQRTGYERLVTSLTGLGYRHWTVFDNFGEVLLPAAAPEQLPGLFDYVQRQNQGRSTRTLHYYDLLVAGDNNVALARQAVRTY
jgi:FkbM family methyltransferase